MTDTVHPLAARGFEAGADSYERARPDYPAEAVAAIGDLLDLGPGRVLLELGAGTGKLTRQLVPFGARMLALEPVEAMRARLAAAVPGAELVNGAAESIPLPGASVDAVVVAQAFHWFDVIRALSEIHRVLRPGGSLVLVWNLRDESVAWVAALRDLIDASVGSEAPAWQHGWRDAVDRCALFLPLQPAGFRHAQRLTVDALKDRVSSISTVAVADPSIRAALLVDIEALRRDDLATAGRDEIELPYSTEMYWTTSRALAPGASGIVASVNVNRGGVPKPPVDGARILRTGPDGDGHLEPEPVHGGPGQAVCLYAQEAIERVRVSGDAAFPGAFGENLTLLGIDWATLSAGDRLAFGEGEAGAMLELTKPAAPCQTIAHWFVERRIARVSHKLHPEDARWYARVLREGPVAPGMIVRVMAGEAEGVAGAKPAERRTKGPSSNH